MPEELSRERLLELLAELTNVQVGAKKDLSTGLETISANPLGEVLLTRKQLEKLIVSQPNINIYAFHSSGINNVGDHSSN